MRRLRLDRRCATASWATHDVIVAVPAFSHRRPFPLSPLLVLWRDGTTGERAPLIRFWPLQRLPVAWRCSGAASRRKSPAAALDSVSSGASVSPLAHASPPVRYLAWRVPDPALGVHPSDGDDCASRSGSCIVAYLYSAMFRYPCLGNPRGLVAEFHPATALLGFGPSQC
jgi:hypothetical protein